MVVGFVWYGPLFSNKWMQENKFKEEDLKGGNNSSYFLTFLSALFTATISSFLVHFLGITDLGSGLILGLMLGFGYVGTTFATNYIFSKKSFSLYLIDSGYQVLMVVVSAVVGLTVSRDSRSGFQEFDNAFTFSHLFRKGAFRGIVVPAPVA